MRKEPGSMERIAIFYASEGTGHRTAAENLAARFMLDHPNGKALCYDILDCVPRLLHAALSNYYLWSVKYCPALWGASYWNSDTHGITQFSTDFAHKILCKIFLPRAEKMVRELGAEAVFFTHYFGGEHFASRNPEIPTFFVNTDFETHAFQRSPDFTATFCASETSVRQYEKDNISPIFNTGIPVAPKYETLPSKQLARRKLQIEQDATAILVSGGGIGAGEIERVAHSLAQRKDWQIIVICGNNKKLKEKLAKAALGNNVRIEGYVTNIDEYYRAADLGIIKPGGLTLAEALASELPLLLMSPIPGQEECNLHCVCEEHAAIELKNADNSREAAENILETAEIIGNLRKNAQRISKPHAAAEILKIATETANLQ